MARTVRVPAGQYVRYYDPQRPHHRAWLQAALERLDELDPAALQQGSPLRALWLAGSGSGAQGPQTRSIRGDGPAAEPSQKLAVIEPPAAVAVALPLVKEFEGCRLEAYPDPETGAEPWTIGWGSTRYYDGAPVKQGDRISQELADALLAGRLERDARTLARTIPGWSQLGVNQQAALLSFSYNCGPHWYGHAGYQTLSAQIRNQAWGEVPAALMLYVNPGGPSEAGLRRRRKAEGALWSAAPAQGSAKPPAAKAKPPAAKAKPPSAGTGSGPGNPLLVPHFSQLDSSTDQARRMCFSSSCAMLLAFLRPGVLQGANGDDQYLQRVQQFGDTTDPAAQIKALASYGIQATFSQKADFQTLERQIDAGIPVPCGYLHRGPVTAPAGGGHWLIVVGYDATSLIVHDPLGEADLAGGATLGRPARFCRYSRLNFGHRWMVEGNGSGWAVVAASRGTGKG